MRRLTNVISIMAVTALLLVVGVFAADKAPTQNGDFDSLMPPPAKNECLIVAKSCMHEYGSVQDRAADLRKEISRGPAVYTEEELNFKKHQLNWIETESGKVSM